MKIRTECPKNNKYYIRIATGGYNGAVAGKPTQPYANVLDNCVGYANGRFNEIGEYGKCKYQLVCNAENFIEAAKKMGLKISPTPIEGGIMVWQKGATLSSGDGAGHVAVVERVYDDGSIMTSESGWNAWAFKTVRRTNSNGRWGQSSAYRFRGCIINPAVKDPKVVPVPPLNVDGIGGACTVRAMQRFFGTLQDGVLSGQSKAQAKYYPALKAVEYGKGGSPCVRKLQKWIDIPQDGIWNEQTSKALQKKLGVSADGIFGSNSMKALQKYLNDNDKARFPADEKPEKPPAEKPAEVEKKPYDGQYPDIKVTIDGAKAVAEKANEYAYKEGAPKSDTKFEGGHPTPAYKSALASLPYKSHDWCAGARKGANCDVFVWVCVRKGDVDSKFPSGLWNQLDYMEDNKWQKIKASDVKPGDIYFYRKDVEGKHGHIGICYSGGRVKEASHEEYYPKTNKSLKSRLNTKGKKYVKVFRPPSHTRNYMKNGDKGDEVKDLQAYLNWFDPSNKLAVDGIFKDKTEEAVKKFQKATGLTADGYFGTASLAKAKEIKK